jgi:hypothetical protein
MCTSEVVTNLGVGDIAVKHQTDHEQFVAWWLFPLLHLRASNRQAGT